jgi:hypothetical protein
MPASNTFFFWRVSATTASLPRRAGPKVVERRLPQHRVFYVVVISFHPILTFPSPPNKVHAWIDMLTVAQPYFQRHDFRGDMILHAAFPHPLLKRFIALHAARIVSCVLTDRADALSRYFEPRVYQRYRAHLCLLGLR